MDGSRRAAFIGVLLVAASISSCVSADTKRELEYRRAEVAAAEARLIELAPGDKRAADLRTAVAEARGRLEKARAKADRERREGMGFLGGVLDKVMAGASPLLSLLVPGAGAGASLLGRVGWSIASKVVGSLKS